MNWTLALRRHTNAVFVIPFLGGVITTFFFGASVGVWLGGTAWAEVVSAAFGALAAILGALFVANYNIRATREPQVDQALHQLEDVTYDLNLVRAIVDGSCPESRDDVFQSFSDIIGAQRNAARFFEEMAREHGAGLPGVFVRVHTLIDRIHDANDYIERSRSNISYEDVVQYRDADPEPSWLFVRGKVHDVCELVAELKRHLSRL